MSRKLVSPTRRKAAAAGKDAVGGRSDDKFRQRAHDLIPGGAHTYSRGDDQLPAEAPSCFVRAKGGRVWDLQGREYVDWAMGINNVIVGHAEDSIDDAAIAAIRNGLAMARPTPAEVDAAEAVLGFFIVEPIAWSVHRPKTVKVLLPWTLKDR